MEKLVDAFLRGERPRRCVVEKTCLYCKGELWKIERDLLPLLAVCRELLSDKPLFVLVSGYASGYSSLMLKHNLAPLAERFGGVIEHGELAIPEVGSDRALPCGIFGRWSR